MIFSHYITTKKMQFLIRATFNRITKSYIKRLSHTKAAEQVNTWLPAYAQLSDAFTEQAAKDLLSNMIVHEDFLSEVEENGILSEIEPYLKNLHYEFSHWDDAIHGYRETERMHWTPANEKILDRVRALAFTSDVTPLQYVHILDLSKKGYIKPHIDATRFCGDTITGLSLLSDSIMRLVREDSKDIHVDVLLKRRSLYVMKGVARFKYTHEILENNKSMFKGKHIEKDRRISIVCRNAPVDEN